jgi:hypothetical protein
MAYTSPITTSPRATTKELIEANQQSNIAAVAMTFAAGAIDTGTEMVAAEAAEIVADLAANKASIDSIVAALESYGILADS